MDPFQRHYAYHSAYHLNADAMREAAKHFLGKHDFSAFVNVTRNNGSRDPVKDIFRFDVTETVFIELHATVKTFGLPYVFLQLFFHTFIFSSLVYSDSWNVSILKSSTMHGCSVFHMSVPF